jgi:hypothetical protein
MKRLAGRSMLIVAWCLLLSWGGATIEAQRARPAEPAAAPDDVDGSQPAIHPDAVSSFVTRTYRVGVKRLWEELLTVLEENGYPPEEIDAKSRVVKTSFIDFVTTDYSEEVAGLQPRYSAEYPILQMRWVKEGKVSLEARVTEGERGTDLTIRARILVQGLNRKENILVLTDRRSSGVIEADFLRILEDKLELERL